MKKSGLDGRLIGQIIQGFSENLLTLDPGGHNALPLDGTNSASIWMRRKALKRPVGVIMSCSIAFIQQNAYEKISVHCLAAVLRQAGHRCEVFIEALEEDFLGAVADFDPDYCAVSLFLGEQDGVLEALGRIKARLPRVKTLAGGPFATIFPEVALRPEIDYLLRGDSEETLPELLRLLEDNLPPSDLAGVSYVLPDGRLHADGRMSLCDVSVAPMPDRDLYYKYPVLKDRPTKIFVGSRGCPYRCTYCYNAELAKFYSTPYWRVRPVGQVIEEIRHVTQTHGCSWVHFQDGTFNANPKWLAAFLDSYTGSGLPPFLCNCRVENMSRDLVRRMRQAGCERITFGIQSGSERVRRELAGRSMSNEQIQEACRMCKEHGIRVGVDIIFGWPGETLDEAMETIRLCRDVDVESCSSNVLIFYPGLRITNYAVENGYIQEHPTLEDMQRLTPNTSLLRDGAARNFINMDKLFNYFVKFPMLTPLLLPLLKLPPNTFFYMLKDLHLLRRSLKYDVDRSWMQLVRDYCVSHWCAVHRGG